MNIYDIAKESGVSISTVSRVLNGHPNVNATTKERVISVLEKYNYVPSGVAQSLVSKSTRTIGVITLDVRHAHYANIAFTIEQELSSHGYNVMLCNTGYDQTKMDDYVRILAEKRVDGVIIVGSAFSSPQMERSIQRYFHRKPIVMHNTTLTADNIYDISTRDDFGVRLSVEYLLSKGISNIAFIRDYDTTVAEAKLEEYRKTLIENDIGYTKDLVVRTTSGIEGGERAVEELFEKGTDFSAIVGCDDVTCLGAMRRLARRGIAIPSDVAVIGCNNTVFSQISDPPMTVVDNRAEMTGISLSRTIIDVLKGRNVPSQAVLCPELIIRGSA